MEKEKVTKIAYGILCGVMVIAILWLLAGMMLGKDDRKSTVAKEEPRPTPLVTQVVVEKEVEKFVEVEKTITSETVAEGLNDMGFLVTEEYYFTMVESYEKTKSLFKFITTKSNFLYSYDGELYAGVNFENIKVAKDDDRKIITITIPKAEVQSISIDKNSFKAYEEKEGWGNELTMEDFNKSLLELENAAEARAIDRGVLDRANENAKDVVGNFVKSLVGDEFAVEFK